LGYLAGPYPLGRNRTAVISVWYATNQIRGGCRFLYGRRDLETADTYLRRAEAAERAAEVATDETAKRMLKSAAQRWRQLAEIAERNKDSMNGSASQS